MVQSQGGVNRNASFRDLDVWHEAMRLVEEIYGTTKSFPRDELFGLCSEADYERLAERASRVGRMLNGLITSLQPAVEEPIDS